MNYIVVKTYGNGCHMNKVFPMYFKWLSQAERWAEHLNETDAEDSDKWIVFPLTEYVGKVWD